MSDETPGEAELLRACIKGDTAAFEVIVGKYQTLVCAITYGATADLEQSEELAHEVFIKVWTSLSQLRDLSKFRAWLYAIVQNIIRNYFRDKKRDIVSHARPLEEKEDITSKSFKGTATIIDKEQQAVIRRALEQIPEKYRTPLVLFYRQGQSIKEVAEMLELSEEAVKTQISRGRKLLKEEVAAMVETTISRTGPGKAFTTAVIASVAGLAIKGSAAAAAGAAATVIAGGKAAILSGVTAKIITAAAVVIIGVGAVVAYKQVTKTERVPDLPKAEMAIQQQEKQSKEMENISAKAANKIEESKRLETETSKETNSKQDKANNNIGDYIKGQGTKTGMEGFVIDKSTSKPIQGAKILCAAGGGAMDLKCLTDANGHFESVDMQPQKQQYIYIIAKDYTSRKITLDIIKDKVYENFKIELTPGSKAAGAVYDQNGKPVKGATVGTFEFYSDVVTDANGTFEIDGLDPAWGQYTLGVTHPNYPSFSMSFTPANAGGTVWQEVILKPGVTIYGQVTNERGLPISGVGVGTARDRYWCDIQTKTDDEGRYELKNVDARNGLVLCAIDNKHAPYIEDVNYSPLSDKMLKNIQLADSVPLHGKIIDKEGNAVSGVDVSLREYKGVSSLSSGDPKKWVTSDSEGKFILRNAPSEGKVILELCADFIVGKMTEVEAGQEEEYIIEVERSGKIYGSVVEDKTNEPIRRFNVKINPSTKKSGPFKGGYEVTWSREGHYFDSAEGFFDTGRATAAVGTECSVTIYADGFAPLTIDPVAVQPINDKPNRTEFRLKPANVIAGRVADSNGVAISGARIRIMPNSGDFEHWDDRDTAVTNSNGEFYLSGLGQQEQLIYITAETYGPYKGSSADLPKDSNGDIQITLERGAEVSGRVFDSDGKAVADARVSVFAFTEELIRKFPNLRRTNLNQTMTDANGYYEIYDLPAGSFSMNVSSSLAKGNLRIAHKKITLEAGQYIEVNFGDDEGFAITGTVRGREKPLEKAEVGILLPDEYMKWSYTDNNGRFKITGVPKGTYNVSITYRTGYNPKTLTWEWEKVKHFTGGRLVIVDSNTELDIDLGDVSSKGENP